MTLWQARHAKLKLGDAVSVIELDEALWDLLDTNTTTLNCVAKDIEITEPARETEEVKLLGSVSGAQCQELDEKAASKGELKATLILNPEPENQFDIEKYKLTATAAVTAVDSETTTAVQKRYNYSSAPPANGLAIAVRMEMNADFVVFLLNDSSITTLGGVKIDADGHATQELTANCAADDFWKEYGFA